MVEIQNRRWRFRTGGGDSEQAVEIQNGWWRFRTGGQDLEQGFSCPINGDRVCQAGNVKDECQ